MERPRRLVRFAAATAGALLLVGTASACSSGPLAADPAATVGDVEITRSEVLDQVALDREVAEVQAKAGATAGQLEGAERDASIETALAPFEGPSEDTVPMGKASEGLTMLIQREVLRAAMVDAGGKVTDADRTSGRESAVSELEAAGLTEDDVPARYLDERGELYAVQAALTAAIEVTEEDLRAAYPERVGDYTQVCVSVIVTADEERAAEAIARIDGGEEFAAVATEVSIDEATRVEGGVAGCGATADVASSLGEEVATAEVGELTAPQTFDGGAVFSQVTSRDVPTFDDIAEQLRLDVQKALIQEELQAALVEVEVDPRYGTWDVEKAAVVPPAITTTTLPVAVSTPDATTAGP